MNVRVKGNDNRILLVLEYQLEIAIQLGIDTIVFDKTKHRSQLMKLKEFFEALKL